MPFRVGILDTAVALVVAVVILMPARAVSVKAAYPDLGPEVTADIGRYQAELLADPGDGVAAYELSELLVKVGQTDWALQVAAAAADHKDSPTRWKALLALSSAHADRIEVKEAHRFAKEALDACEATSSCPDHEKARLMLYFYELDAGVKSGIDPRIDPGAFQKAVRRAYPRATYIDRSPAKPSEAPAPKTETPKTEAPKTEAPKTEAPSPTP